MFPITVDSHKKVNPYVDKSYWKKLSKKMTKILKN